MGRDRGRPNGYAPLLQFYLRKKLEGGGILKPGQVRDVHHPDARRSCLVLVHGFNNTDSEAANAYLGFRKRQLELYAGQIDNIIEEYFGDAYWPGDAGWWSFFDKADFLIYPASVHTAVKAARELYDLLTTMPNLEQVDFVAHSLGCRVTLEVLLLLRKRLLPKVRSVCLMAAAVPAEMLEPGGKFSALIAELGSEGTRFEVLHSDADTVLHYAFPPGQTAAGIGEASMRALGRVGVTPAMPWAGSYLEGQAVHGAGHGDYWGHSGSAPSREATEMAGRFLKLGEVTRTVGSRRPVASVSVAGLNSREVSPESRSIGD